MKKIIFVPLDERPCNLQYPQYIGAISGLPLCFPPRAILGNFKKEANVDAIWQWIVDNAADAGPLVLSMDMFLYGGIVPSRLHHLGAAVCRERADRLRQLRAMYPELKIYAYQLITRAPARDGSGEEPDYYENYGYRLYRFGVIRDKQAAHATDAAEDAELTQITAEIPADILQDFLDRRALNFKNNLYSIDLATQGIIDYLLIPLDDCREFGFAPSERRQLSVYMAEKNMLSHIAMYPGADEVGCTLLARAINSEMGEEPAVYLDWSSVRGQGQIPSYEDRSIGETVQYHLLAAGCGIAELSPEADFILAVNPPTKFSLRLEKEWVTDDIVLESERNFPAFIKRIQKYLARGQRVGVADCAIPNGADRALMQFLYEQELLQAITAYAGWNTSSNTIGTVVAMLVANWAADQKGSEPESFARKKAQEFLFLRYLEDWGYMAVTRRNVTALLPEIDENMCFLDLCGKQDLVKPLVMERLNRFVKTYLPWHTGGFSVCFPWNRMFEVELTPDECAEG